MELKPTQVERQLAGSADLAPVWLIAGDEHLLVIEAADAVRRRARELGFTEREVLDAEPGFDWDEFARAGASLSLFAARRVIDLRMPTGRPDRHPAKAGAEALQAFCSAPPPDTVLLITCMAWSRAHETKWVEAVRQVGVFVPCWPLKAEETRQWLAARALKAGLRLTDDAVDALLDRVEGNLLAAGQEIDKLRLLIGVDVGAIGVERLAELVADSARFDVFKLADAALGGDAERALRIVAALRAEGEQVPALVPVLSGQVALVSRLAAAVESGRSVDAALRAEPGVWASRHGVYRAALARGRGAFWEARLAALARVERAGKGRAPDPLWRIEYEQRDRPQFDPWLELERAVAAIADPRIARRVAP
ncbi:MAG: DNA polymerase III subunit delta [Pseudomonadota bacterium]|jgi:DNA polymerase-3 subunit delta